MPPKDSKSKSSMLSKAADETHLAERMNTAPGYGACGKDPNTMAAIVEHGSTQRLLQDGLIKLVGCIAPLLLVTNTNLTTQAYKMDCGSLYMNRGRNDAEYVACAVTYPFVYCFPYVAILACILLVACRMAHIRAFYVLFKHGVLVDFENPPRIGRKVSLMMCGLLLGSCIHFLMILSYGGAWMWHSGCHEGPERFPCLEAKGWKPEVFINTQYDFKTNTWLELMMNPALLNTKPNQNLIEMLNILVMQYLLPSIVAIAFAESCDNFESDLVPVTKLMEANPSGMAAYLMEMRAMTEPTVRDFILSSSRDQTCDIKDLCENLRKQKCATGEAQDAENTLQHHAVTTGSGNYDLSFLDFAALKGKAWWPVKMLIDTETSDLEGLKFKLAWGIYFLITAFIAAVLVWIGNHSVVKKIWWVVHVHHKKPQLWNVPQIVFKTSIGVYYCLALYMMLSFASLIFPAWAEIRKLKSSSSANQPTPSAGLSSANEPTPSATITAATPSLMP